MNAPARHGLKWLVPALAALTVSIVATVAATAGGQTEQQLRIAAQRHADGQTEVALQQRPGDGVWSARLLPQQRFVAANAPTRRWLASSSVTVGTAGGVQELRIAARRHGDGRVEVALQQRRANGTWGERVLPALRFIPAGAAVGRWVTSSPLFEPEPPAGAVLSTSGESDIPQDLDQNPEQDLPRALITPTGIPVPVIGRAGSGYLVRTPCGNAAQIATGEPIESARVVLDPGHGGPREPGAVGPNGLTEKALNLTLSRAILAELETRGIAAATTRTGDYGTLLSVRAAFADALGADALISIHHNAPTWILGDSPGTEVYIQSTDDETPRTVSQRLGGLLYEEITTALRTFADVRWSRLANPGVLRVLAPQGGDAYGMISRPATPAVLVEYGYLSNVSEADLFATDEYIDIAAVATANAIEDYLNTDRPGSGFVEQPRRFDPAAAPSRCAEVRLE